jgi:hypothetical protein
VDLFELRVGFLSCETTLFLVAPSFRLYGESVAMGWILEHLWRLIEERFCKQQRR